MAVPSAISSALKSTISARPNNYGVTHVGISNVPDKVIWYKARLVRKYTGYPQNIYDGDTVYDITNKNYVVKVASVYGANPISTFTYSGGGTIAYADSVDYKNFYNVPATGGSGNGATFNVVRTGKAAGGTGAVVSVTLSCAGEGYTAGNSLTLAAANIGGGAATDITVVVSSLGASASAGIKTINTSISGSAPSVTMSNIAGVSVNSSVGKNSAFNVSTGGTVTVASGGSGFAVNDYVSIPSYSLGTTSDTSEPNSYGTTARYHIYDTVGSTATTTNPTTTAATSVVSADRVFYSLFINYSLTTGSLVPSDYYWNKVAEGSSVLIKDTGTATLLANHLPKYYVAGSYQTVIKNGQSVVVNDLLDFLKVFAFQLDIYKTQATDVFYMTNTLKADETLIKMLLKQFGGNYKDVNDVAQARVLLNNIIRIFQTSGSKAGLSTLIESYTGYNSTSTQGRNYMHEYNSASFEDGTGYWYPTTDQTVYPTITSVGPIDGSIAAFTDSAYSAGQGLVMYSASGSGTTITVASTANLQPGAIVSVSSGTGAFSPGTVVTAVLSSTTFRVNRSPSTTLSSATIKASYNLVTGMAKVLAGTGATTAKFYLGPKKLKTTALASSGATTITMKSGTIPAINDYVLGTGIPFGTYITAVNSGTSVITLSASTTASIASGTELWFSASNSDKTGASTAWIIVEENKPYSFSTYANLGGAAATPTVTVSLYWYDIHGNAISNVSGTALSISTGSSTWLPAKVTAVAPLNAAYAEPQISITGINATTIPMYLDAVQFEHGIDIVSKQLLTSTSVELVTSGSHNFTATDTASGTNSVSVTGLGAPYDGGPYVISSVPSVNSVRYTIPSTTTATQASAVAATGGVVSSNTFFEDVKINYIDVIANRINLITNPSFEIGTVTGVNNTGTQFWYATNAAISSTTTQSISGPRALKVVASSTSTITMTAYAGTISGGTITSTNTAFVVEPPSTVDQSVYYTFSFYTYANATARSVTPKIVWSTGDVTTGTASSNTVGSWTRHSLTATVPPGAYSATLNILIASPVANEIHYIDDVLFEYGSSVKPYFDGSFDGYNYADNTGTIDSMWEYNGIPNACRSHYYTNRVANAGRLKSIITDGLYYA